MAKSRGLNLGVVGCGVMGTNHARLISTLTGVTLAGVADSDLARAQDVAARFKTEPFANYHDLLPQVEALIIASPTQTHYQVAKEALEAGKHLLVEKPFTGEVALARELANLAKANNRLLTVGFIERFNPAFVKLLKIIKGERLHGLAIKRFSPYPARISDTNVIFDMMIHDLALLPVLLNDEIEFLKAEGKKTKSLFLDEVSAVISCKNGLIVKVEADRNYESKLRTLTVTTDKAVFDCDLLNRRIYVRDFTTPTPSAVSVTPADQLISELENFINAIKGKGALTVRPEEAIAALTLAKEIEKLC